MGAPPPSGLPPGGRRFTWLVRLKPSTINSTRWRPPARTIFDNSHVERAVRVQRQNRSVKRGQPPRHAEFVDGRQRLVHSFPPDGDGDASGPVVDDDGVSIEIDSRLDLER